ncbi:SufE family protein [Thermanaerothrix sp. 4228-RoL]|uniref:SufE family protein n=1 Tax=Thermanaerothrix solaris TaxID=3058434 RepID=A0ABU3NMU6_9CHLR|nr:SufE family protein [Thermanaerothrix sp. 4228-RoL]MDT8897156.1 SufE family protein [Thermanaerothrix sp. 4228-RoL]
MDRSTLLPPRLAEILDDFALSDRQEKMELLLEFSASLLPVPEGLAEPISQPESVPECMTPVTVYMHTQQGRLRFYFDIPPEAPTIRGYAAILQQGLWDTPPEGVLRIPDDFYLGLGLHYILTPQRLNGLIAIMAHIKRLASHALTSSS